MKRFFFLIVFCSIAVTAQEKLLHFRIVADSVSTGGITVVNLVNERSAVSDVNGNFSILAKEDDLIVLSSMSFEYKRELIDADDLKSNLILIRMTPKPNALDEVVVNAHPEINAVDLGILSKPAKVYTPAERRLKTASEVEGAIGFGAIVSLDPLLNYLSGRTKMLKKELEVERRERVIEKLGNIYEESYFVNKLKIPPSHVQGFLYYAAENQKLVEAVNARNNTLTAFILSDLSNKYRETLQSEK